VSQKNVETYIVVTRKFLSSFHSLLCI